MEKLKKLIMDQWLSLYEFEPAPGVKVSKIINLSDDIARNTSSVSAEFLSYLEKILLV